MRLAVDSTFSDQVSHGERAQRGFDMIACSIVVWHFKLVPSGVVMGWGKSER